MNITTEANLAAQWILNEKVIAYPTEGVWGIGGLNTSENIKAINLLYFLNLIGKPIISTSANLSGERTCKNIEEISAVFNGTIYGAFDGQLGGEKKPSKILDLENNEYIR